MTLHSSNSAQDSSQPYSQVDQLVGAFSLGNMTTDDIAYIRRAVVTDSGIEALASEAGVAVDALRCILDASGRFLPSAFLDQHENTLRRLCIAHRLATGQIRE